jgi:uncharacterized membrane protein (DUF106 family)
MNDPMLGLLFVAVTILVVGVVIGFYADHMRRKYEILADAERDAADRGAS